MAYSGGYAWHPSSVYNELIGTQLLTPLSIGVKYYVSLKANLTGEARCAVNNIGVLFSTIQYCDSVDQFNQCYGAIAPLTNSAHVYSSEIIYDTTNWTTISGSFVADSTYGYMMIGNLFEQAFTNDSLLYGFPSCNSLPYYFIDDICVSPDSLTCVDIQSDIVDFFADSTNIQQGSCLKFNLNTAVDYEIYNWQFSGATPANSTDSMPINICYPNAGIYTVTLIAGDSSGCGDTITKINYIIVDSIVGINEAIVKEKITIHPNPTSGKFTVQGTESTIQVYDLFGRLVLETPNKQADMSSYPAGIYIWQIGSERGKLVLE